MFQNISVEDEKTNKETNEERRNDKIQTLKKFFTIRNCIIYLLSFFISKTPIGNFSAPFGLAIFAAACSNEIPAGIIYVMSRTRSNCRLWKIQLIVVYTNIAYICIQHNTI